MAFSTFHWNGVDPGASGNWTCIMPPMSLLVFLLLCFIVHDCPAFISSFSWFGQSTHIPHHSRSSQDSYLSELLDGSLDTAASDFLVLPPLQDHHPTKRSSLSCPGDSEPVVSHPYTFIHHLRIIQPSPLVRQSQHNTATSHRRQLKDSTQTCYPPRNNIS